jgi:hypothetical protein
MKRIGFAFCFVFVLAVGCLQTVHRANVEYFIWLEDQNPVFAGAKLASEGAIPLNGCSGSETTEIQLLARAIFAVETLASGRLERFVESSLVRVSLPFGLRPPDFSIGLGQIRPSTVERIKPTSLAGAPDLKLETKREIVRALLEPCEAMRIGSYILENDIRAQCDELGLLPRQEILRAARIWNGQSVANSGEAALAGLRYQELVYQTFIALRSLAHLTECAYIFLSVGCTSGRDNTAARFNPQRKRVEGKG